MSIVHTSHKQIVNRLRRVEGHLRNIVEMIEKQRPCGEIAQQMHAVSSALDKAKKVFIYDHIDHCLDKVSSNPNDARKKNLAEFKEIAKYL
jgi:uncharacterized protein